MMDFSLFLESHEKLGCVMAFFDSGLNETILRFCRREIPESVLASDGRENEPHVTILYGLLGYDPEPVQAVMSRFLLPALKLGPISKFENDHHDVIKISIKSQDLHDMNAALRQLPCKVTYPEYIPHLTLAYVQSNSCDHLLGKRLPDYVNVKANAIMYSTPASARHVIAMG